MGELASTMLDLMRKHQSPEAFSLLRKESLSVQKDTLLEDGIMTILLFYDQERALVKCIKDQPELSDRKDILSAYGTITRLAAKVDVAIILNFIHEQPLHGQKDLLMVPGLTRKLADFRQYREAIKLIDQQPCLADQRDILATTDVICGFAYAGREALALAVELIERQPHAARHQIIDVPFVRESLVYHGYAALVQEMEAIDSGRPAGQRMPVAEPRG